MLFNNDNDNEMLLIGDKVRLKNIDKDIPTNRKEGDIGELILFHVDRDLQWEIKFEDTDSVESFMESEFEKYEEKVKVYLAAPFFSEKQIEKVEMVERALFENETVRAMFSPRHHQECEFKMFTPEWAKVTMENDIANLEDCDVVVAITDFDGYDTDAGTAFELGWAAAKGMKTYLINFEDMVVNLMLTEKNVAIFKSAEELKSYSFIENKEIPYTGKYR